MHGEPQIPDPSLLTKLRVLSLPGKPGGRRWFAHPDSVEIARDIAEKLDVIETVPGCALLKKNPLRAVYRLPLGPERRDCIVKHYHPRRLRDLAKHAFVKPKAHREWEAAARLSRAGIRVPAMLAIGEKRRGALLDDACLVMETIQDAAYVYDFVSPARSRPQERGCALRAVAELCAALHINRIFHPDLHPGNLLFTRGAAGQLLLYLIDLHAARFPRVFRDKHRIESLSVLMYPLGLCVPPGDVRLMWDHYVAAAGLEAQASRRLWAALGRSVERLRRAKEDDRTLRCLGRGSRFATETTRAQRIYRATKLPREQIVSALQEHRSHSEGDGSMILNRAGSLVATRTSSGLCVRQFPNEARRSILGRSKGQESWITANGLLLRGIGAPEPLAMVEERDACYLITTYMHGWRALDDVLRECASGAVPAAAQEAVARAVGSETGKLHARGIHHRKPSAKSFIVGRLPQGWKAHIVDIENVDLRHKPTTREKLRALARLNAEARGISTQARMAFVHWYNSYNPGAVDRRTMAEIDRLSRMEPGAG